MTRTDPKPTPRRYQRVGIKRIWKKWGGRGLLADEMGLGKSPQALWGHKWHNRHPGPLVIVCPAYLKYHWESEVRKYTGLRAEILDGETPPMLVRAAPAYIINYDILTPKKRKRRRGRAERTWVKVLRAMKPSTVVVDEAQYLKTHDTARTKAVRKLQKGVPHFLALSGTGAMENCPAELWPVLNMIDRRRWATFYPFGMRYCAPRRTPWRWEFKGATNVEELNRILRKTCFPADTLVQCRNGLFPIGELVRSDSRTEVLSYDLASSSLQWKSIVAVTRRASPSRLIRVVHEAGEFTCTLDHLIYTEGGYVRAENLASGVQVQVVSGVVSPDLEPTRESGLPVLHGPVCGQAPGGQAAEAEEKELRVLHHPVHGKTTQHSVLLPHLLGTVAEQVPTKANPDSTPDLPQLRLGGSGHPSPGDSLEIYPSVQQTVRRTDKMVQDQGQGSNPTTLEDLPATTNATPSPELATTMARVQCTPNPPPGAIPERGSPFHDGRSGTPGRETGDRSGRPLAQASGTEGPGQVEGTRTATSRVVRTQVLESGDRHWPFAGGEDDSVYDIEVEGNHNFYANGVLVHNCMVRRLAKDVLKELPGLSSHVVEVGLSNRKEYDEAERDLIKWLAKTNARKAKRAANAEQLVKWAYLRRCLADGKVRAVADWVRDFLDSGHKLLVFGFHTSLLEALCKEFKKDGAVLVTGKVPAKTRSQLFARFNDDPKCRVLFGNIDAGGTGWSCRATSTVAFCELMWNPAKHRQAMKRVHGLNRGVPGEPARAVFLTARNTIEQPMGAALQKKQAVQDAVLDGKKAAADMDLRDMMERFLMKKGK